MSGRVVRAGELRHECAPGWHNEYSGLHGAEFAGESLRRLFARIGQPTETTRVQTVAETTKVEKPVIERGGYSAGGRTVSELPPPPPSVSVQGTGDGGSAPATNQTATAPSSDNSNRDGPPFGPGVYAFMPDPREYRKGTVWECDCGRTWVSRGPIAGFIHWRRERRGERRRREKRVGAGP